MHKQSCCCILSAYEMICRYFQACESHMKLRSQYLVSYVVNLSQHRHWAQLGFHLTITWSVTNNHPNKWFPEGESKALNSRLQAKLPLICTHMLANAPDNLQFKWGVYEGQGENRNPAGTVVYITTSGYEHFDLKLPVINILIWKHNVHQDCSDKVIFRKKDVAI